MKHSKKITPCGFTLSLALLLGFLLSGTLPLYSQLQDKSLNNYNGSRESFYTDPLVFYFPDSLNARLDIYLEVPYDNLQFKSNSSGMRTAQISYTLKLTDETNRTIFNDTYSEDLSVAKGNKNYKEDSKIAIKSYPIAPGKYNLNVNVTDKNATLNVQKNYPLTVNISSSEIYSSSMMLVSDYGKDGAGKQSITPSINNNIGNLKEFFLFYELYNKKTIPEDVNITYSFVDAKNTEVLKKVNPYTLQPGSNKIIERIPTDNFVIGDYKLDIKSSAGTVLASKNFNDRWLGLPFNIKDLDLAISQMVYIARSDELKKIKESKSTAEKERKFIEFWKSKDPSPNTTRNELMIEYYSRVKIANEKYSNYKEGWKTDMGMVYIIFGVPGSIDRHPFDGNAKPYEVWDYYDANRQFVFIDDSGFGDYRLLTPIYETFKSR